MTNNTEREIDIKEYLRPGFEFNFLGQKCVVTSFDAKVIRLVYFFCGEYKNVIMPFKAAEPILRKQYQSGKRQSHYRWSEASKDGNPEGDDSGFEMFLCKVVFENSDSYRIALVTYDHRQRKWHLTKGKRITHWMVLPEIPK